MRSPLGWYRRSGCDQGVATVWTAVAIAALLTITGLMFWLGTAAVTRHRAGNAADLAALAAAGSAARGPAAACAEARSVAENMGARLRVCRFEGWDALIRVEIVPKDLLSGFGNAQARARAGPVASAEADPGGPVRTTSGPRSD